MQRRNKNIFKLAWVTSNSFFSYSVLFYASEKKKKYDMHDERRKYIKDILFFFSFFVVGKKEQKADWVELVHLHIPDQNLFSPQIGNQTNTKINQLGLTCSVPFNY